MLVGSTAQWVSNNSIGSALIGNPPNTQRDWYIVRGLLRVVGMGETDPASGFVLAARKTDITESKRSSIIAGLVVSLVIILSVTLTRLALRLSVATMRFGIDDWATIAAAGMGLTYTTCQLIMAIKGGGDHIWEHTYEDYNTFNYYGVLDKIVFYATVALIKTSLALFIRRLTTGISKKWRRFCDFFLLTLALYLVSATIWFLFTCDPLRAQWDLLYRGQLEETPSCIDGLLWGRIYNVAHVVQGVVLLLSPMVILWKVRIEIKKKIRLFFIWAVLLIWTALDVTVGIVVISLPVLDDMIAASVRKAILKTRKTNTGGRNGYGHLDKSKTSRLGPPSTVRIANPIGPDRELGDDWNEVLPNRSEADQKLRCNAKDSPVELNIIRTVE
ncbi:hypothetical protein E2P81_ATG07322 [Venturia nashicola]|nr:hypothetical protein E2P81_ATG07322 [Venturia nashicola]